MAAALEHSVHCFFPTATCEKGEEGVHRPGEFLGLESELGGNPLSNPVCGEFWDSNLWEAPNMWFESFGSPGQKSQLAESNPARFGAGLRNRGSKIRNGTWTETCGALGL